MIPEQDRQQSQADIETSSEKKELKKPASTFQEESANVNPKTWTQICENSGNEYLKSFVELVFAYHSSMDEISKRQ
ncbi:MAG: hypothetical protein ACRC62_03270 [Microcoleus sp.]